MADETTEWGEYGYRVAPYADQITQHRIVSVNGSYVRFVGNVHVDGSDDEFVNWIKSTEQPWFPTIEQAEAWMLNRAKDKIEMQREGLRMSEERLAKLQAATRDDYYTPCKESN